MIGCLFISLIPVCCGASLAWVAGRKNVSIKILFGAIPFGSGIFTRSIHRLSFLPSHHRPGVNAIVVVVVVDDVCGGCI